MPRDSRPCDMCDGDDTAGEILLCEECELPVHAHCVFFTGPLQSKVTGCAANVLSISPWTKRVHLSPQAREFAELLVRSAQCV